MDVNVKINGEKGENKGEGKRVEDLTKEELEEMLNNVKSNEKKAPEIIIDTKSDEKVEEVKEKSKEEIKEEAPSNGDKNCNCEKEESENKAKGFLNGLLGYISNPNFEKKIVEESQRSGLDKRQVANNFAMRVLGTISDLMHLALDTIKDAFSTLVSILAGLLIKGGDLAVRCAKRITRIVTLNQTVNQIS